MADADLGVFGIEACESTEDRRPRTGILEGTAVDVEEGVVG